MKNKKIMLLVIALSLLVVALPASAALIPACALGTGVPQLSCFLELAVSVSKWILGITGSLALLFFVYGGFMFLTSRGNTEQITKGKTILTQAAIGIIIIFGAYLGVNFLVNTIGGKFTTEFKIEKPIAPLAPTPAQKTAPTPPPTGSNCVCIMSTSKSFIGFKEQGEFQKDIFLSKICQDGLQGVYNQDTDTCKPDANTPLAKGCISFSVKKDDDDVKFSCSMK